MAGRAVLLVERKKTLLEPRLERGTVRLAPLVAVALPADVGVVERGIVGNHRVEPLVDDPLVRRRHVDAVVRLLKILRQTAPERSALLRAERLREARQQVETLHERLVRAVAREPGAERAVGLRPVDERIVRHVEEARVVSREVHPLRRVRARMAAHAMAVPHGLHHLVVVEHARVPPRRRFKRRRRLARG